MNKKLTILVFLFIVAFQLSFSQCYSSLRKEGLDFKEKKAYQDAIFSFLAAKGCPRVPFSNDLDDLIKETLRIWEENLKEAVVDAEKATIDAVQAKNQAVIALEEAKRANFEARKTAQQSQLFIEYLEAKNEGSENNGFLINILSSIIEIDTTDHSALVEYCYYLRGDHYLNLSFFEKTLVDYEWLLVNGNQEQIFTYSNNYLQLTRRLSADQPDLEFSEEMVQLANSNIAQYAKPGYKKLLEELDSYNNGAYDTFLNFPLDEESSDTSRVVINPGSIKERMVLSRRGNNYYTPGSNYGKLGIEDFFQDKRLKFKRVNRNESVAQLNKLNSQLDAIKLDSITTSSDYFLEVGPVPYTLGHGNGKGNLASFLKEVQSKYPEKFETYFGKFNIDYSDDTDDQGGYLIIDGELINTRIKKLNLHTPEYIYVFWKALQDEALQALISQKLIRREMAEAFLAFDQTWVFGYPITQLVTSEAGFFHLLETYKNNEWRSGRTSKKLRLNRRAIEEAYKLTLEATKKLPAKWQPDDEQLFLKTLAKLMRRPFNLDRKCNPERGSFQAFIDLISTTNNRFYDLSAPAATNVQLDPITSQKKDSVIIFLNPLKGGLDVSGRYLSGAKTSFEHSSGTFHDGSFIYEGVLNRSLAFMVAKKLRTLDIPFVLTTYTAQDPKLSERIETVNLHVKTLKIPSLNLSISFNRSKDHQQRGFLIDAQYDKEGTPKMLLDNVKNMLGDKIEYFEDPNANRLIEIVRLISDFVNVTPLYYDNLEDAKQAMDPEIIDLLAEAQVQTIVDWIREK